MKGWSITVEAADWVHSEVYIQPLRPMHSRAKTLNALALIGCLGLINVACSSQPQDPNAINQTEAIKRLDYRLQQLEQRLEAQTAGKADEGDKTPPGPVKSLTLRLGTVDDRLRIYWENGTTTNLPCTEEQKTWVCG